MSDRPVGLVERAYMDVVKAVGPGFHPDTDPWSYTSLPEGITPTVIEVVTRCAQSYGHDVYTLALHALSEGP